MIKGVESPLETWSGSIPAISKLRVNINRAKNIQIFLDWDDTLIPTSMYMFKYGSGERRSPKEFKEYLSEKADLDMFDKCLYRFLFTLNTLGDIKIVTSSERGWPELACGLLFPKSAEIVSSIPIIYASEFGKDRSKKYEAMLSCVNKGTELLVSIGDSDCERYSSLKLKENNIVPKVLIIKLTEHPSVNILLDTLIYMGYWITHMVYTASGNKDFYEIILDKGMAVTA
jgi:hypothetical protein